MRRSEFSLVCVLACLVAPLAGCVHRTISITSNPPGALLWLNEREIGRTPIDVDFLYYGTYDVVLESEGYETLLTTGDAVPPWWDNIPFDFFAELSPGDSDAHITWHYQLQPRNDDPAGLLERARQLRDKLPPPPPPATLPAAAQTQSAVATP